ncbi:ribulokinase [Collibacillus ludicampi]|uniref:Ribulokinase n=1 Tax=Collibacillus ludicampi TaxID=2771369 RepID=A0AAV4LGG8_9BACL|nr:ribulokinase [Collibacillus ludicampi]GIM46584.1 ribulokinase [Collibacillus ludicampi]
MKRGKYAIGIDFGTESGRAVLVDITNGWEVSTHVTVYPHGVITEKLPESDIYLDSDFALQDPDDYLEVLRNSVPHLLKESGIHAEDVIGIGIDFTSNTMIPVDRNLQPLCRDADWRKNPHSWVKLWKHHATQEETEKINRFAIQRNEPWLKRYGGRISSEWMIPKCWQILNEAPEIYQAADLFLEASDWITAQMTGQVKRNNCAAGFKSFWHPEEGYPSKDFFSLLDSKLADITETKLRGPIARIGSKAGYLRPEMAEIMGLYPGLPVAVGMIDAHAAVLGMGVVTPGKMVMVMGTSTCHMLLSREEREVEGISGVVKDGIIPGLYAYEAGQSAVGDLFAWFVKRCVPAYVYEDAKSKQISIYEWLEREAGRLKPGESGLLALDWHNGNRSPLDNADLSGLVIGNTLLTKPEEIYRALLEATAFGARVILEEYEKSGLEVNELYACGGLPHRNRLLMQIYADIMNREIKISETEFTPAVGAAILGAVAAGKTNGGYETLAEAAMNMGRIKNVSFKPIPEHVKIYNELYQEYLLLQNYFGRGMNDVMGRLKKLKDRIKSINNTHSIKV